MRYATQYIKTAAQFIQDYDGGIPLHHYLKSKFSVERKYGSKDRRYISHLCYAYFRLGHFLKNIGVDDRIKVSLFLTGDDDWKTLFNEEWLQHLHTDLQQRIAFVEKTHPGNTVTDIFPWHNELSCEVYKSAFTLSHLTQPYLFIRIRPGKHDAVKGKLAGANISFTEITSDCLAFGNGTKLENVLEINKECVIQDMNSQRAGEFMKPKIEYQKSKIKVWDCCAASGGKAIMAYDLIPKIQLTVSDIRPAIIHNLNNRLKEAGIQNYHSFVADLSCGSPGSPDPEGRRERGGPDPEGRREEESPNPKGSREKGIGLSSYQPINKSTNQLFNQSTNQLFDLIICDAPCSGSGTWSRTPEQLYFFKPEEITHYSDLQKKIASNVIPFIKQGGHLLYITCSVFRKENEEVVEFIQKQFGLTLVKMELLKGYDRKADTLFVALFAA